MGEEGVGDEGVAGDLRPPHRYVLPAGLRGELARPHGPVVATDALGALLAGHAPVIAVGDVVSLTLHGLGIRPLLFVCDYHTERGGHDERYREVLGSWGERELRVANPPATVTREAWDAVRTAIAGEGTTRIVVDGEEDLVGIPVFLECPLGSRVLYGAPGRGVVVVTADAELRRRVEGIVARMERE